MRRWICLLALALLLTVPATAYEIPTDFTDQTLEDVMETFMAENGLNQKNYSVSYYNTVTEEAYTFNDDCFMVAASTYKLPLNMYYYDMEREGEIASDAYIKRAGAKLDVAHKQSLVHSNNEMSIGMLYNLGDFRTYKTLMRKYFTMEDKEIDEKYFRNNYYCTRMMMDALKHLYANSEDYGEMLDYMKQAQPDQYFRAGVTEYEVAHKYGWYDGAVNDVGIIYAPEPFLLAVYTQDAGESPVADTAALLTAYQDWAAAQVPPEPEGVPLEYTMVPQHPEAEEEPEDPTPVEPEAEPEPEPAPEETPQPAFAWWMVAVALGVFVLGGGATLLILSPKRLKMLKEEEEVIYED